jgi:dihydroorotate dehydrogenase
MLEIVDGLSAWLAKQGVDEIAELIGTMQKGTVDVV